MRIVGPDGEPESGTRNKAKCEMRNAKTKATGGKAGGGYTSQCPHGHGYTLVIAKMIERKK
ncbi:hypothetical protein FRC18_008702 [Serendipita sp. 400]|nr:hypothetical protein FRC18_008702 [Serendipita sp. 400]